MDDLDKIIASMLYPCNQGGDWSACKTCSHHNRRCRACPIKNPCPASCNHMVICGDYIINQRKQHVADIMTVVSTYTGKADDFDKRIAQAVFPCNTDGDFHICDKIHCPADMIRSDKKQVADILSAIYTYKKQQIPA